MTKIRPMNENGSEKKKSKKKIISAKGAIKLYLNEGFYMGTCNMSRCCCSHKAGKQIENFILSRPLHL